MELKLNRGDWTYFIKFGGKDSCKLTQMAFDPYVFRKRQYIQVENWELEVEQNYWKKEFQEIQGYPEKTFHDFLFTTSELRMTTLLQEKHVDGTVIDEALLRVFNQSEIPVLNIYFKNITINKIIREGKDCQRPLLTILFDYKRIKMEYLNTPTGKGPAAKSIAAWNLKASTGNFEDPVYETVVVNDSPAYENPHTPMAVLLRESGDDPFGKKQKFKILVVNHHNNVPIPNISFRIGLPEETFYKDVKTNNKGMIEIDHTKKGFCETVNSKSDKTLKKSLRLVEITNDLPDAPTEEVSYAKEKWEHVIEIEEYKVKSGDSLKQLADDNTLSVNVLTAFNWETTKSKEINTSLYDVVGCTEKAKDGKNYIFSNSDDPGIIYIPKKLTSKLDADKTHVFRVEIVEINAPFENNFEFSG